MKMHVIPLLFLLVAASATDCDPSKGSCPVANEAGSSVAGDELIASGVTLLSLDKGVQKEILQEGQGPPVVMGKSYVSEGMYPAFTSTRNRLPCFQPSV
jgi:hypothetical protein